MSSDGIKVSRRLNPDIEGSGLDSSCNIVNDLVITGANHIAFPLTRFH